MYSKCTGVFEVHVRLSPVNLGTRWRSFRKEVPYSCFARAMFCLWALPVGIACNRHCKLKGSLMQFWPRTLSRRQVGLFLGQSATQCCNFSIVYHTILQQYHVGYSNLPSFQIGFLLPRSKLPVMVVALKRSFGSGPGSEIFWILVGSCTWHTINCEEYWTFVPCLRTKTNRRFRRCIDRHRKAHLPGICVAWCNFVCVRLDAWIIRKPFRV